MELQEQIQNLDKKVTSILQLLRGNELDKTDTGIAGTVNDIDKRVEKLEKWKDRFVYLIFGASAVTGAGIGGLISKIFSH